MALELELALTRGAFRLEVRCALPTRGVTALFGRSGSGKTTLLRCIAGLERLSARVRFDGVLWQDETHFVPTWRRAVGYVFQEPSLFPHQSARGNLEYGLHRAPGARQRVRFEEAVGLLGLESLLAHRAHELSGGERQRVAIARALLASPQLLLMDEPLSSLDELSKAEILPHLQRLHAALPIPIIYVSHSLDEVTWLADDLALLQEGCIRTIGPMAQLLTRPDLPLGYAERRGALLQAMVESHDDTLRLSHIRVGGEQGATLVIERQTPPATGAVRVRIDARDVSLALQLPAQSSFMNVVRASVLDLTHEPDTAQTLVRVSVGDALLLARIARRAAIELGLAPGSPVYALISRVSVS
jgi:molybdate transport system ATP-binding protein